LHKAARRAVFIGRFQPFHLGHLEAVKQILQECNELIIAVGSAQYSYTLENPFTAGERIEMIRIGLEAAGLDLRRIMIIPVPDIGEHSIWVARLKSMLPKFDVAYTNNQFVKLLLEDQNVPVIEPKLINREELNATSIRALMIRNEDWKRFLQPEVASYIESIRGDDRIRKIVSSEQRQLMKSSAQVE